MFVCVQNPPGFPTMSRCSPHFPRDATGIRWPAARPCRRRCTWMCSEEVSAVALESRWQQFVEHKFFHVETGKHQCFWCRNLDETGSYNLQSEIFFWCFAWSTNVGEPVEMGGQRFCLILTKESIQMVCSVTEWRSDLWTCKFSQALPKMQMESFLFFSVMNNVACYNHPIYFWLISRPAGRILNPKRFMIHWRRHDEQKGNLRGLRRRKMNGWSKKTSATSVCLCKELPSDTDLQPTIRSSQHHMTSCYVKPGHATASQHITTFCFTVLQNFQKIFASSSFIWESLPRNAFWEIWAWNVHLAFPEVSQDVFIFMFFFRFKL